MPHESSHLRTAASVPSSGWSVPSEAGICGWLWGPVNEQHRVQLVRRYWLILRRSTALLSWKIRWNHS